MQLPPDKRSGPENTYAFLTELLAEDVHAARVMSVANGVVGVMHAAALGIHAIGRGLADALDLDPKHAIKQVDRLLSNQGIDVWRWFDHWVRYVVADRKEVVVILDWTDFTRDGHQTIALYLVTTHGRATPLLWKTTADSSRTAYETELIQRLHEILDPGVDVTVLADRGFGDDKLFSYLDTLGWGFIIRFQQRVKVAVQGVVKPAADWVPGSGHVRMLQNVLITIEKTPLAAVVLKHQKGMKEAWCLATNRPALGRTKIVKLYAKRFTIEETFRDVKDHRFGLGLSSVRIGSPERRDRLLFIAAVAQALMTLLGAAGESCGLDRILKANTSNRRTMSLFNQGCYWYRTLPNMREDRLRPLMTAFGELVSAQPVFAKLCGVI